MFFSSKTRTFKYLKNNIKVSKQGYLNERGIKKLFYVNYFVFYNTDLITIFFNKFLNSSIY